MEWLRGWGAARTKAGLQSLLHPPELHFCELPVFRGVDILHFAFEQDDGAGISREQISGLKERSTPDPKKLAGIVVGGRQILRAAVQVIRIHE